MTEQYERTAEVEEVDMAEFIKLMLKKAEQVLAEPNKTQLFHSEQAQLLADGMADL